MSGPKTAGYETFHPDGRCTVTRTSGISGVISKMEMPIKYEQYQRWLDGALIQDALPHLNAEQREFLMTGITPEEWAKTFPPDDE